MVDTLTGNKNCDDFSVLCKQNFCLPKVNFENLRNHE